MTMSLSIFFGNEAVLGALVLAAIIWVYLLVFHGRFWRVDQVLPVKTEEALVDWPEVVACIPARDEADVIGVTIQSHMNMAYPGIYHVVLADDGSGDGTALEAKVAAGDADHFHLTSAPPLEAKWTGKLWALNHAIGIAETVAPDAKYLLLTDADITYAPDVLQRLVVKAEREDRALVSVMAKLDARGFWASLLIPAFVFFFQKLYPFFWINDARHKMAGAAGGCVLVNKKSLISEGGLNAIKDQLIDDCALGRLIKGVPPKRSIWLGLSHDVTSHRDNRQLEDIWSMVARTAFTQLDYSWLLLMGTVLGMGLVYLIGPIAAFLWIWHGNTVAGALGVLVWMIMAASYLPMLSFYQRPAWYAILLPLSALMYSAMTLSSGLRHLRGRGGLWKGRAYPSLR